MGSESTVEDVPTRAQPPQDSKQRSELQQGLSLPEVHAPEQPSQPGSSAVPCLNAHGSDNHAGTSLQDATSQDVENNAVRGASDCDVFYDAVSLHAPLTAASQDFWDNLETEPSSDNPFDDAASSLVITACDSGESDIFFPCHMGTEPSARQAALQTGLLALCAHLAPQCSSIPDAGDLDSAASSSVAPFYRAASIPARVDYGPRLGAYAESACSATAPEAADGHASAAPSGNPASNLFVGNICGLYGRQMRLMPKGGTGGVDRSAITFAQLWGGAAVDYVGLHQPIESVGSSADLETRCAGAAPPSSFAHCMDSATGICGAHAGPAGPKRKKPSLKERAKQNLKGLKYMGRRISSGIGRCVAAPTVKDSSKEECVCMAEMGVMTAAELAELASVAC
ncbi:g10983 [Coccomyxa viridis]|uniref:G10983 protein n=1 Tax=Coccomyxa viridis TaxID=1274662 RepID=A0ABP1GAZ3_9CHLO